MIEYGILAENELPLLLELYKQLEKSNGGKIDEITAKNIWKKIENQNIKYFTARENGKIISSCYICVIPNLTRGGRSIGYIENVITDRNYRRKGIGRKIIENAIEFAKEQNCYKVLLQSRNDRKDAHIFYEAIGFNGKSKRAFEIRI